MERKGLPFVFPGVTDVTDCNTAEQVITKAKLNWNVDKCELGSIIDKEYYKANNAYGIYRTDKNIILGVVKGRYTAIQNTECFKFFNHAIGKNKAVWQTAGCYGNGEKIFVSAKLPNNITVNGDVVENYLVFSNSHDGTSGVKILFTPVRLICFNMLNAAFKQKTAYISFRHTQSVHENIDIANEILGICKIETEQLSERFNYMNKITVKDEQARQIFADVILTDKEKEQIKMTGHTIHQIIHRDYNAITDSEISMKKVNTLSQINNYYYNGIGQREIVGTGWGVYNAITGYYSNVDNTSGIKRMDTLLYGDRSRKIETAGNLILKM